MFENIDMVERKSYIVCRGFVGAVTLTLDIDLDPVVWLIYSGTKNIT